MAEGIERGKEFLATLEDDAELQSKMAAATTPQELKKVIEDAGFGDVTPDDVKKAVVAKKGESGELSEDELSAAAGAGGLDVQIPGILSSKAWW